MTYIAYLYVFICDYCKYTKSNRKIFFVKICKSGICVSTDFMNVFFNLQKQKVTKNY